MVEREDPYAEIRRAYQAGAMAGMLFAKDPKGFTAPDVDAYIKKLKQRPIVARF